MLEELDLAEFELYLLIDDAEDRVEVPFRFRAPDLEEVDRLRDTERVEPNFSLETKLLLTFRVFERPSTLDAFALTTLSALDTYLTEGCLPEREIFPRHDILFLLNATFDIRLA